jgi:hypothetical protein
MLGDADEFLGGAGDCHIAAAGIEATVAAS